MWDNILGHQSQKDLLERYLLAQEPPHALLFVAAEGLGKKQLPLAFAKALLCAGHAGSDRCPARRLRNWRSGASCAV